MEIRKLVAPLALWDAEGHNRSTIARMDHRKQLSVERIVLFSDAVFAIAITLLVIELRAPEVQSNAEAWQFLQRSLPKFLGFTLSFFVIGIFWLSHHRLFGYLADFNTKMLWLNLLMLFTIAIMPFSTAFYSENPIGTVPYLLYSANVFAASVANAWLWRYVTSPLSGLSAGIENARSRKYLLRVTLVAPAVWALGLALGVVELFFPSEPLIQLNRSIYLLLFPCFAILSRRYRDIAQTIK